MTENGVTWIAYRVPQEGLPQASMWGDSLGWTVLRADESAVVFTTADAAVIEFCGPGYDVPGHLFARGNTVTGFLVEDLDRSISVLVERGFTVLAERSEGGDVAFAHLAGPGDLVIGLIQRL